MTNKESAYMNNPEQENITATVEMIAPDGLGFGEGGISVSKQIEEGIITKEAPVRIHELLINDPEAFKSVEARDDGCGDGRPWSKIIQQVSEGGQKNIRLYKNIAS